MDPLSITASVIAVATLALHSSKKAYDLLDRMVKAPVAIVYSKNILSETRSTLESLTNTLTSGSQVSGVLGSVLQKIKLGIIITSTQSLCDEFCSSLMRLTSHSTDSRFSKLDRLVVALSESKINKFNEQLSNYQRVLSLALVSINLIISNRTVEDIQQLSGRFAAQERALVDLEKHLRDKEVALQVMATEGSDDGAGRGRSVAEHEPGFDLATQLHELCKEILSATKAKRSEQKFGDIKTEDGSMAFQGEAGCVQGGTAQSFGSLTSTKNSVAAQGRIDAASFAIMFGKR